MQDLSMFLPATDLTTISQVRYLKGKPQDIRFDAKDGVLKYGEKKPLTENGEPFQFIPIAWRAFSADGFLKTSTLRNWVEMFFLNKRGEICCFYFHSYSFDDFEKMRVALYYQDLAITDVLLKVTLMPKSHPKGSFYAAKFSYTLLSETQKTAAQTIVAQHDIFCEKSMFSDRVSYIHESVNVWQPQRVTVLPQNAQTAQTAQATIQTV